MKFLTTAIAGSLLSVSGAAAAQSATDAQCAILSSVFAQNSKEPRAEKIANASLYYYVGRLSVSNSTAQLKTLLDQQAKTIPDAKAAEMMNGCAKTFQAVVQSLSPEPPKKPEGR